MRTSRRTCVGCRQTADVTDLVRVFRTSDGRLHVGPGPGRGAWLCASHRSLDCLATAIQRGALERALRGAIGSDEPGRLRAKLEDMSG